MREVYAKADVNLVLNLLTDIEGQNIKLLNCKVILPAYLIFAYPLAAPSLCSFLGAGNLVLLLPPSDLIRNQRLLCARLVGMAVTRVISIIACDP